MFTRMNSIVWVSWDMSWDLVTSPADQWCDRLTTLTNKPSGTNDRNELNVPAIAPLPGPRGLPLIGHVTPFIRHGILGAFDVPW